MSHPVIGIYGVLDLTNIFVTIPFYATPIYPFFLSVFLVFFIILKRLSLHELYG